MVPRRCRRKVGVNIANPGVDTRADTELGSNIGEAKMKLHLHHLRRQRCVRFHEIKERNMLEKKKNETWTDDGDLPISAEGSTCVASKLRFALRYKSLRAKKADPRRRILCKTRDIASHEILRRPCKLKIMKCTRCKKWKTAQRYHPLNLKVWITHRTLNDKATCMVCSKPRLCIQCREVKARDAFDETLHRNHRLSGRAECKMCTANRIQCTRCKQSLRLNRFHREKLERWKVQGDVNNMARCMKCGPPLVCVCCRKVKQREEFDEAKHKTMSRRDNLSARSVCRTCEKNNIAEHATNLWAQHISTHKN